VRGLARGGDEGFDVVGKLGAVPGLGADDFAGDAAIGGNDVSFREERGAIGGGDVFGGVAVVREIHVVIAQEFFEGCGVFVDANAENGGTAGSKLRLERSEGIDFIDAGRAPGGPEIEDDHFAVHIGEVLGAAIDVEGEVVGALAGDGGFALAIGGSREGDDQCGGENDDANGDETAAEIGHGDC
jgi:hypothetical protein